MPSISVDFLRELHEDYTQFPCFIETGTLNGDTTFTLEPHFSKLYTIELSELYYYRTKSKYTGNKISFLLGDSSVVFESLLPTVENKCIFFLDGHWSSDDTGKGQKDCPLYEEITHINNLFQQEAIIIIDDVRLFGLGPSSGMNEDWTQINKETILNILKPRIQKVYSLDSECAKDDRLIIHIGPLRFP